MTDGPGPGWSLPVLSYSQELSTGIQCHITIGSLATHIYKLQ